MTAPDGLLKQFTKSVLETALNEEMTEHLGHAKNRAGMAGSRPTSVPGPGLRWSQVRVKRRLAARVPIVVRRPIASSAAVCPSGR